MVTFCKFWEWDANFTHVAPRARHRRRILAGGDGNGKIGHGDSIYYIQ